MTYPRIIINLDKIRANTERAVSVCGAQGIEVVGVTKACLGDPEVGRAMLDGGAVMIGDSRLANLRRHKEAGIKAPLMMLRLPSLSEADELAGLVDISLNSELSVIETLGRAANACGSVHEVILMVDMGDGREGIRPQDVGDVIAKAARLTGIRIKGIGTNVACLAGAVPTPDNMELLCALAADAARITRMDNIVISSGNSSAWELIESGTIPHGVNQVRFGEAILLGRETARGRLIEGMCHDAFVIEAEIVESIPARGNHHIAALGRQDIDAGEIYPVDASWMIGKASSDHLVLVKDGKTVQPGAVVSFIPGYESLMRAMTSPFVAKQYV